MARLEDVSGEAWSAMDELRVPGVVIGVVAGDEEEVVCRGVTSLDNPLPVTPETLFQIGSIGKTYVAAAIVHLVERGQLELDVPVRTYIPDLALADEDAAARATVRHLLTHTGGWVGDVFEDFGRGDDALALMVGRLADVPQLTPLGEVWSYNNAGFAIAGRVIETVTEKPFEAAMRDLVLAPLGLGRSFYFPEEVMTYRFAVGHIRERNERPVVAREWWIGRASHAAGGITCSLGDLLRYAQFAFDGSPLLAPESFAELRRPQVPVGGAVDAVGLAWMLRELDGVQLISHGGGTNGQVSWLCVAPDQRFAVAVLTNHEYGGVVIERLREPVLQAYLGIRDPEPRPLSVEPDRLAEYAGLYTSWMADAEVAVSGAELEVRLTQKRGFPTPESQIRPPPPPGRFLFYDEDWVFAHEGVWRGERAGFLRGPDGRIEWFQLGGRVYARA
ncbi:MAG: beta-lactamase family protein [Actinomycetota bacterium]|nr:beta-lactamase family protein [Actinomycetota bacterium]